MEKSLSTIITESLEKSMTYQEYRDLVDRLVSEKATTGEDQSEALVNFTALNQKRYKRLDKTIELNQEQLNFFSAYANERIWLVLTEAWCADASQILPVLAKMADANPKIQLKLVLRDENEELMNHFLTNGGKAVPKVLMLDAQSLEVLQTWGPRPSEATRQVEEFKAKNGKLTMEFKTDLQKWYNADKGQNIISDFEKLLLLGLKLGL